MTRQIVVDASLLSSGPTVLASETWTGANGAAWPAQWQALATNGSATIQNNRGRLDPGRVGYVPERRALSALSAQNVEAYAEFTPTALTEQYIDFCVRQDLTRNRYYPDGYFVSCDVGGTVWTLGGVDTDNGQFNNVDTTVTWDLSTWAVRLRAERHPTITGSTLVSAKVWKLSAGEPASWVTITDSSYQRAGSFAIGVASGNTTKPPMDFDNVKVIAL